MNSLIFSSLIRLLIFSVVCLQLTSSASFPNTPHLPPPNATPEQWDLFMKFLHNYYAIMARPRFGKRNEIERSFDESDRNFVDRFSTEDEKFDDRSNRRQMLAALFEDDRRRRR